MNAGDVGLAAQVDGGAVGALQARHVAQGGLLEAPVAPVVAGQHVRRRALVDVEVGDPLGQLGDDLDRRRPGADHGDPPALEVDVVVPARGVEQLALEGVDALDVGQAGLGEPTRADHERARDPGDVPVGARGGAEPALLRGVPARAGEPGVEDEAVQGAGLAGHPLEVGLDLRLRREGHRPVGVGRERERVQLAGHVARGPGVGVVAPGPADVAALLDDGEVPLAVLLELDGRAQPGEPGAHDEVVDGAGPGCGVGGSGLGGHVSTVLALLNECQ